MIWRKGKIKKIDWKISAMKMKWNTRTCTVAGKVRQAKSGECRNVSDADDDTMIKKERKEGDKNVNYELVF